MSSEPMSKPIEESEGSGDFEHLITFLQNVPAGDDEIVSLEVVRMLTNSNTNYER